MTDLTPERIRDAAEVHHLLNVAANVSDDYGRNVKGLLRLATAMEREAEREKRIEQLTREITAAFDNTHGSWTDVARVMLERYPALINPGPCDKGPCCLSNGHDGGCSL